MTTIRPIFASEVASNKFSVTIRTKRKGPDTTSLLNLTRSGKGVGETLDDMLISVFTQIFTNIYELIISIIGQNQYVNPTVNFDHNVHLTSLQIFQDHLSSNMPVTTPTEIKSKNTLDSITLELYPVMKKIKNHVSVGFEFTSIICGAFSQRLFKSVANNCFFYMEIVYN